MPVDSPLVFFPIPLVVIITIFCIVTLCKHFCKADSASEETVQNRSVLTNLLRENLDSTAFLTCSNNSIPVSSDRNQIISSASLSNDIPITTNNSAIYNMSSNVISNTTRSNVFSRASSDLDWLNIPPRVSTNGARERNSVAASPLVQNEDLYSRLPNEYSHGIIFESFNRNNRELTNTSVRSNSILTDRRNYGVDTISTTSSYMSSNAISNSTRSNVFSRASSGLEWLNIPPRVSTNGARERNNATASTLVRNEDLYSRVPSVYSHGAIFESFNRNNTESTNTSVRSNSILTDPRNYRYDTICTTSRQSSMVSRDSTSSNAPLYVSITGERERNNETASISLQNENLFSRVPSLYSHGAVFDSFGRNSAESTNTSVRSNSMLTDARNYEDDTIYPTSSCVSSMASRNSTSSDVPLHASITGEREKNDTATSISLRNENLFSRVPSLYSHGAVFDSINRNHRETYSRTFLVDPGSERNYTDNSANDNVLFPITTRGSSQSDVPSQVPISDGRERRNTTASILSRNDLFSRVPSLHSHGSAFDSPHRNDTEVEVANTSASSTDNLEDSTTVEDNSSNGFPTATSGSTASDSLPQASINGARERSSTTASYIWQDEDLFARVPTVYSHGAVIDSLYRNNAEIPDSFSNSYDIDSGTIWDFTNYLDNNFSTDQPPNYSDANFRTDQPPNYSDVLLGDANENQVENFGVRPSLPETPPPSYEEI